MNNNLQVEEQDLKTIKDILSEYPYKFYAYGSRVKWFARQYSDLDLCYKEEISWEVISNLREKLINSNLPFIVELVNWNKMSAAFQNIISKDLFLI